MSERQPITYADHVADLPESDFSKRLKELRMARAFAEQSTANDNLKDALRELADHLGDKTMVEQERPYPAPRPSPDFAADIDAASFDARWEAERQRAAQSQSHHPQTGERPMSDDTQDPRRPEDTLREGPLKAAIWRNNGEHGAYHSVTVARTYKDRDGHLQNTQSFRAKDMLGLSELARRAHHTAHDLDREVFKDQRREEQGQAQSRSRAR